jgi:hypothetical protein
MNVPAPKLPDPTGGTPAPPQPGGNQPAPPGNKQPAPAPKPEPGGSIYKDVGLEEPGKPGSSSWPTDWRDQMAEGAGTEASKLLARYQSPADMAKALVAAQQKIRSGEYKRATPTSDNPEELKAWRDEQGIPETPDGYEMPAVPGVDVANLDEGTKASLAVIREGLHRANLSKDQGNIVAQALVQMAEKQTEAQAQTDAGHRDAVEDSLRAEWGVEYRKNLNMNGALLTQHFGDGMDNILNARTPDGVRLADMPEFNKFLNNMARANGNDVLFDGDVKGTTSIDARLEEIRAVMSRDINEYHAKGLDKEYNQLLEKQAARGGR